MPVAGISTAQSQKLPVGITTGWFSCLKAIITRGDVGIEFFRTACNSRTFLCRFHCFLFFSEYLVFSSLNILFHHCEKRFRLCEISCTILEKKFTLLTISFIFLKKGFTNCYNSFIKCER